MPFIFIWCAIGLSQCAWCCGIFWNMALGSIVPLLCHVCFLLPSKFCAKAARAHCSARKTETGCCLPLMTCAPSLPEDPLSPDFECAPLWTDINGATGPLLFHGWFVLSSVRFVLLLCGPDVARSFHCMSVFYHMNELLLLYVY